MRKTVLMIVMFASICGGVYLMGGRTSDSREGLAGIFLILSGIQVADYVREHLR